MGGNALGHHVRRHPAAEYHLKALEVSSILRDLFRQRPLHIVKAYDTKESFGDLDVVLLSDDLPPDWVQQVCEVFSAKHHQKNGNVLSVEYKELQVDIITHSEVEYAFACRYYAYNDLGNLMGRTAFGMGLKLAHDGLYFRHKHDYKDSDVFITGDWRRALQILGFNPERWYDGFHTLEDIFDFVRAGMYYTTRDFLLENRNHKSKTRDAKRQSYMKFLDYIQDKGDVLGPWSVVSHSDWKIRLVAALPGLKVDLERLEVEYARKRLIKSRFNGFMVRELTGLKEGKDLGEFMASVKAAPAFEDNVLSMETTQFRQWVYELYQCWSFEDTL